MSQERLFLPRHPASPLPFHPPRAMTIYALYIYNRSALPSFRLHPATSDAPCLERHCECIYYHDWHQSRVLQPPREGTTHRRNVARYGDLSTTGTGDGPEGKRMREGKTTVEGLPFDEQAKLVYGVLLSLRNMCKKLSGRCVLPLFLLSFRSLDRGAHSRALASLSQTRRTVFLVPHINLQIPPLHNADKPLVHHAL